MARGSIVGPEGPGKPPPDGCPPPIVCGGLMQRPDEKKRALITATAARLFATRPFHKVRLDDIAAEAKIGKGTLYIYFDSKEDLYFSLIYGGFAELVDRLREQLGAGEAAEEPSANGNGNGKSTAGRRGTPRLSARDALERIVAEMVRFTFQHPQLSELMRTVGRVVGQSASDWAAKRTELQQLIEETIRRGVRAGELVDPYPELTALCVPGMVRSLMLFGPKGLKEADVVAQIMRLLEHGIAAGGR